ALCRRAARASSLRRDPFVDRLPAACLRERDLARQRPVVRARRRRAAERSGGVADAVLTVNHGAHFGMVDAPAEERHANGGGDGPVPANHADQQQEERERLGVERRVIDGEMNMLGLDHFFASAAARSVASFSALALIGGLYAAMPVTASPMMRLWMSCVPSYVFTDSRFIMWRITGYSSETPFAPRMSRAIRADSRAMFTLFIFPIETWCGFSFPWSFSRPICSARSWPLVISVIIQDSLFCTS